MSRRQRNITINSRDDYRQEQIQRNTMSKSGDRETKVNYDQKQRQRNTMSKSRDGKYGQDKR